MMLLNELKNEEFYIETHLSRANPIAKNIENTDEVLCDFLGANTYISSSWYNHLNVSTWNYEAVQIYGKIEIMTNDELFNHLNVLTSKFEFSQKCPVTIEKMGKDYVENEMKGTIGLKIIPTEILIKQKLSQNRDEINYKRIIEQLEKSSEAMDLSIAEKMKKNKKKEYK